MNTRVLIVDDEAGFTRIVKLTLEARGNYMVREVNDPTAVLRIARAFLPDVVLLDVIMRGQDGGDVLSQLKADALLKHVPVILVTATVSTSEAGEHGRTIGGEFFVAKPVAVERLIEAIEEHLVCSAPGA